MRIHVGMRTYNELIRVYILSTLKSKSLSIIHFVLCSCKTESSERKKFARKHRYSSFQY